MTPLENVTELLREYRKMLLSNFTGAPAPQQLQDASHVARIGHLLGDEVVLTKTCESYLGVETYEGVVHSVAGKGTGAMSIRGDHGKWISLPVGSRVRVEVTK